jgi:hypothetical protein
MCNGDEHVEKASVQYAALFKRGTFGSATMI